MQIEQMALGPIGTNCYILSKDKQALIIDPGEEADRVINYLKKQGHSPLAILLTHAHFDHIGAVDGVRDYYGIPVYLHMLEKDWLQDAHLNGSLYFEMVDPIKVKPADNYLNEGDLSIGDFTFKVKHTPGHSPGSVSFVFKQEKVVISGDALFQGSIGRTDLPGGDMDQLLKSIKDKLLCLKDEYTVYPGHGPKTTIGQERKTNPFLRF